MGKDYKKFIFKFLILSAPIICLIAVYIYLDPFKVVKKYESYYQSGYPSYVILDKDFVSTQTYLNNLSKFKYSSFIFGNSRSIFFDINIWKKYIHTDDCFHFDATAESLIGIYRKFKFLNNRHVKISHALLVLDYSVFFQVENKNGHLFRSHPALSDGNWTSFQFEFFKAFLSRDFMAAYLDFRFSKKIKPYMKDELLLSDAPLDYNLKYNQIEFNYFENMIRDNPVSYYNERRMQVFYKRDSIQKYWPVVIKETQKRMLSEILAILKSNNSEFKIVISPMYDQFKLDSKDSDFLVKTFGKGNVFDFSGINFITNDYKNYYETAHYRPQIAKYLMDLIYN